MKTRLPLVRLMCCLCVFCLPAVWIGDGRAMAAPPVVLRVESLTVPPSTGPLIFVNVKNQSDAPFAGTVAMKGPDGWQISPQLKEISLDPGNTKRTAFTIERGQNVRANSYAVEVSATGAGTTVVRKQNIFCASAPYYKPQIDGDPSDWKDAIPVTFTTGGKKTVVSTFWNRRQFSILVAVEEEKLVGYDGESGPAGFDAVQLALSPQDSRTGASADEQTARFEFLLVATGDGTGGKCFQLATPGMKLGETQQPRSLGPLQYEKATLAVDRKDGVTYYECGLPFRPMREKIRPSEGREFFLSLLVHDPDGTGIRDLGRAAGMWPGQRNRLAWSLWPGAKWGQQPPFDNKLCWGLCTSKY